MQCTMREKCDEAKSHFSLLPEIRNKVDSENHQCYKIFFLTLTFSKYDKKDTLLFNTIKIITSMHEFCVLSQHFNIPLTHLLAVST
jgi:hypothetical protein